MGTLNLTTVTPDTPYIKKIKAALEKATGQSIPLLEVKKVQRKAGVSVVHVFLVFAGGKSSHYMLVQVLMLLKLN